MYNVTSPPNTSNIKKLKKFQFASHLGSPRINTDRNGAVTARHDYHPFGEEVSTSQRITGLGYVDDTVRKQFTGYERDDETELDFAQARMYANRLGRFTTTDPVFMSKARMLNPQEINLFVYCQNNPLEFVDPDGKYFVGTNGKKVNIQMKNGKLTYSKNANADLKRYIELVNKTGSSKAMSGVLATANNATKTHFKISKEVVYYVDPVTKEKDKYPLYGYFQPYDKGGNVVEWSASLRKFNGMPDYLDNGEYKEANLTIFEGSIKADTGFFKERYDDSDITVEEAIVTTGAHEGTHGTDKESINEIRKRQTEDAAKPFNYDPEANASEFEKGVAGEIKDKRNPKKPKQ